MNMNTQAQDFIAHLKQQGFDFPHFQDEAFQEELFHRCLDLELFISEGHDAPEDEDESTQPTGPMYLIELRKVSSDGSKSVAYVSTDEGLTELKSDALPVASADKARAIAADLQVECQPKDGKVTVNAVPIDDETAANYDLYLA